MSQNCSHILLHQNMPPTNHITGSDKKYATGSHNNVTDTHKYFIRSDKHYVTDSHKHVTDSKTLLKLYFVAGHLLLPLRINHAAPMLG